MKDEIYKKRIKKLLSLAKTVPGDVIEVGTFKGKTSEIICHYLQKTSDTKRFIGIDTFKGYMEEDMVDVNSAAIANQASKRWCWSKDSVEERLSFFGKARYSVIEGDCKVKIPELIKSGDLQKLSLIYIDCNLYIPSLKAMTDLWPLLTPGGIMAIDEHLPGGEMRAISEFAKMHDLKLLFFGPSPGPSFYCYKPRD